MKPAGESDTAAEGGAVKDDRGELLLRIEALERELLESRAATQALSSGQVDAVVDESGSHLLLAAQLALQKSEERYRTIVMTADEGIWSLDENIVVSFVNERLATMTGYRADEMIGHSAYEFIDAGARDEIGESFARLARAGGRERHEVRFRRKDGALLWACLATSPLLAPDGQFLGSLGMVTDITQSRNAEALRARLAAIVETSADAIYFTSALDSRILTWNAGAESLYGYAASEAIGQPVEMLAPPGGQAELDGILDRVRAKLPVPHLETMRRRKDGTEVAVSLTVSALRSNDGTLVGASTIARDVSERRRSEEEIRRNEERFRTIFLGSPGVICIGDGVGGLVDVNDRACAFFGYDRNEMIGRNIEELGLWADPAQRERKKRIFQEHRFVRNFEASFRRKDGEVRETLLNVEPLASTSDGGDSLMVYIVEDITGRKRAEEVLRRSEESYRVLFEESPSPMWTYDPETLQIVAANEAAIAKYGFTRSELLSKTLLDMRPPEDAERLVKTMRETPVGRQFAGCWKHRKKDGSLIDVDVETNSVQVGGRSLRISVLHDVTLQRNLEEQLRQAQKMEAVGLLAGGVAHDFNNLLTAILGYGDLLASRFKQGDPAWDEVQQIRRAGERAAVLTRQLLAFSRKQILVPEVLDLGRVVEELSRLLERLIGEDIRIELSIARDLGQVEADSGQMEQVLMNLAVNARDAMPNGGRIQFELSNVDVDGTGEGCSRAHPEILPGSYVLLAVSDTGSGMTAAVRKQIFEPFFTTKETGRGTGLGLSTVHGIVNQSGGTVIVESEPGQGSTFKIYLPRVIGARKASRPPSGPVSRPGAAEVILLVEDDSQLRDLAKRVLELGGYAVLEAEGADQAKQLARSHDSIQLMLSDVIMPGSSGPELAASMTVEFPKMRVLFMSGYMDDALAKQGVWNARAHFLQKPFTPSGLLQKVRDVLGGDE